MRGRHGRAVALRATAASPTTAATAVLLATCLTGGAMLSGCAMLSGGRASPSAVPTPSSTASRDGSAPDPASTDGSAALEDSRALPAHGLLPPGTRPARTVGSIRIALGRGGACANLVASGGSRNPGLTTYPAVWPNGFSVRSNPWRVLDERGGLVARADDYLYVRGRVLRLDPASTPPRCTGGPAPVSVLYVRAFGAPGAPLGFARPPVTYLDCGRPTVKPRELRLSCASASRTLVDVRYDRWTRGGASGTARLVVRCADPPPRSQQGRVRFSMGAAAPRQALLALQPVVVRPRPGSLVC